MVNKKVKMNIITRNKFTFYISKVFDLHYKYIYVSSKSSNIVYLYQNS